MPDHQLASEHVCTCGGNCGCRDGHHQKLTMVAVGNCPLCIAGILEAENDHPPATCSICGFREPAKS